MVAKSRPGPDETRGYEAVRFARPDAPAFWQGPCLDSQARLLVWYRTRAPKDHDVPVWRPSRTWADCIVTPRDDQQGSYPGIHSAFSVESKGVLREGSEDTAYKRSVFDICSEDARGR